MVAIPMTKHLRKEGSTTSAHENSEKKHMRSAVRHLGTEWILMRVEALQGMMQEVNKTLGTGACVVWYLGGKGAGKSLAGIIQKRTQSDDMQEIWRKIVEIYGRCGWGKVQPIMFRQETSEFLIRIYDNAFVKGIRSQTSSCYYVKGLLEGILEQLTGKHAKSEEIKCMAKGDPYCEFVLVLN
jgi:predicted hydrocarbon binding protein